MSLFRTLKLATLGLIDPRLKMRFLELEIEENDAVGTKLLRQKRLVRRELRRLNDTTPVNKTVVIEETTVSKKPGTKKVAGRSTRTKKTRFTTKAPKEDDSSLGTLKLNGKMSREQLMAIIAKHTAPKPDATPQRPPPPTLDPTLPRSAMRSIREFILPDQPEFDAEQERKVVSMLGARTRRRA